MSRLLTFVPVLFPGHWSLSPVPAPLPHGPPLAPPRAPDSLAWSGVCQWMEPFSQDLHEFSDLLDSRYCASVCFRSAACCGAASRSGAGSASVTASSRSTARASSQCLTRRSSTCSPPPSGRYVRGSRGAVSRGAVSRGGVTWRGVTWRGVTWRGITWGCHVYSAEARANQSSFFRLCKPYIRDHMTRVPGHLKRILAEHPSSGIFRGCLAILVEVKAWPPVSHHLFPPADQTTRGSLPRCFRST